MFYVFITHPVGVRSIVINPPLCLSVCLSVHEHISGTTGPIGTKFCAYIRRGSSSVLLLAVLRHVMYFRFYG